MTQQQVAEGILSRQAYSKIERNISEPSIDIFVDLLERLNYTLSDYMNEKNNLSEENYFHGLFLKGLDGSLSTVDANKLYNYVNSNKTKNNIQLHLFGRVLSHLHPKYPSVIPKLSQSDKQLFANYILNLDNHYSLNDLHIIGDFATIVLSYEQSIALYEHFPDFPTTNFAYDISSYQLQICKIYSNFSDLFLSKKDTTRASDSNQKLLAFLKQKMNLRYAFYQKINQITLDYIETGNEKILNELLDIAKIMESIGDTETAKAIDYQYKAYLNNTTYLPEDGLTPDK